MAVARPKVLIIGGGLAGPALALALKKHDIASIVFELRPKSAGSEGGYLALAPNALRVLNSIGVYEKMSKQGYHFEDVQFLSSRNLSLIGAVKNGSKSQFGFDTLRIRRHTIRQTLLAELEEQGIEVRYNSKCIEVIENTENTAKWSHNAVTVKFADGQTESGDFVVGVDGIHSTIRRYIDPEDKSHPIYSGQMGIGGTFSRSLLNSDNEMALPCIILGKNNSFAMMPVNYDASLVGFFATIEEQERSREEWSQKGADHEYLYKTLNDRHSKLENWPEVVIKVCRQAPMDSLTSWPYYKIPSLSSYASPSARVVVIGDAAHAFPPTGGQGAAMGFEDAATLADAIALASSDKDSVEHVQDTINIWQKIRQERIAKISAFTKQGGDMRKATPSLFQQILREWILWVVFKYKRSGMGMDWILSYDTRETLAELKSKSGRNSSEKA